MSIDTIATLYIYPPIPVRSFDWCAYLEGDEEDGPRGFGKTKEEAIENLKEELDIAEGA